MCVCVEQVYVDTDDDVCVCVCVTQVYVDTDDDVRLARRIQRDVAERGRDVGGERGHTHTHTHTHICLHRQTHTPARAGFSIGLSRCMS